MASYRGDSALLSAAITVLLAAFCVSVLLMFVWDGVQQIYHFLVGG